MPQELLISLIVIAVTALVVAGIFIYSRRRKDEQHQRLQALALQQGWVYEPYKEMLSSGYRLKAPDWVVEAQIIAQGADPEPHTSNISKQTRFTSQSVFLPGRFLLIGPILPDVELGSFGEMIRQKVIQKFLGENAGTLQPVQAGSSAFMKRFSILASDPHDVQRLFPLEAEPLMLRWKNTLPVVKISKDGLEIRMENKYLNAGEDLQAFIQLGEYFLKRSRSA